MASQFVVTVARRENPQKPNKSFSKNILNSYDKGFNNKVRWDRKIFFNQMSASLRGTF